MGSLIEAFGKPSRRGASGLARSGGARRLCEGFDTKELPRADSDVIVAGGLQRKPLRRPQGQVSPATFFGANRSFEDGRKCFHNCARAYFINTSVSSPSGGAGETDA